MFKNVGESTFEEISLENGFYVLHFQNESKEIQNFEREINSTFIQIHFCLRGKSKFLFNQNSYSFDVLDNRSILLYNPQRTLPINLEIQPKTTLISLLISIEKFHSLFSKESGYIPFLSDENSNKKYYDDTEIKPTVSIVLQQIINSNINSLPYTHNGVTAGNYNVVLIDNNGCSANDSVFVGEDGGTTGNLTIEPGTRVLGVSGNDFLAVQRGSKIFAEGTAKAPIVFTGPYNASAPEAGAGNWGGLVISGKAPLNICDDSVPFGQCEAVGEGGSGMYGGDDPTDSSGVIKYVRIQFGGYRINDEDELNGLAVQGVGSGTVLDYIQIHANEDDGIEFYGGTANAKHLVLTSIKDDSLDWTHGWQGNLQYVLVKQDPSASAVKERGIEADNFEGNNEATPRSMPMIANATFIGGPSDDKTTTGMVLRRGTGANFTNVIVTGFEKCLDIDSGATFDAAGTPQALTGTLTMENSTISCDVNFEEEDGDAFTVQAFFEAQPGNQVADPALMGIFPTSNSPAGMMMDGEKWGAFFDKVNHIGAFKNQATAWTNGWTEFLD